MAKSLIKAAAPIVGGIVGGPAGAAIGSGVAGLLGGGDEARAGAAGAAAADPFASQRGMYQGILSNLYGGMAGGGMVGGGVPTGGTGMVGGAFSNKQGGAQAPTGFSNTLISNIMRGAGKGPIGMARGVTRGVSGLASEQITGDSPIEQFLKSSPEYQFRLKEGQRALERSASAKGLLQSGNLLRDLVTFGQGEASRAYGSEINRIMTMAGATIGSPGVAGQLTAQGQMANIGAQKQALGSIGYGMSNLISGWGAPTQSGMIESQTGYTGGAEGVLSGAEWESWG